MFNVWQIYFRSLIAFVILICRFGCIIIALNRLALNNDLLCLIDPDGCVSVIDHFTR